MEFGLSQRSQPNRREENSTVVLQEDLTASAETLVSTEGLDGVQPPTPPFSSGESSLPNDTPGSPDTPEEPDRGGTLVSNQISIVGEEEEEVTRPITLERLSIGLNTGRCPLPSMDESSELSQNRRAGSDTSTVEFSSSPGDQNHDQEYLQKYTLALAETKRAQKERDDNLQRVQHLEVQLVQAKMCIEKYRKRSTDRKQQDVERIKHLEEELLKRQKKLAEAKDEFRKLSDRKVQDGNKAKRLEEMLSKQNQELVIARQLFEQFKKKLSDRKDELKEKSILIEERDVEINGKENVIKKKDKLIKEQASMLEVQTQELARLQHQVTDLEKSMRHKLAIADKDQEIRQQMEQRISDKDKIIQTQLADIRRMQEDSIRYETNVAITVERGTDAESESESEPSFHLPRGRSRNRK